MFWELVKFASLLLDILSLDAVLHVAFLEPGRTLREQWWPSCEMLLLAAAIAVAGGFVHSLAGGETAAQSIPVVETLPMKIFWWGASLLLVLFAGGWYVERYILHLWS